MKKEKIINIPNSLTLTRFLLTLLIIVLFFLSFPIKILLIIFIIAALTDFLDGQIARRFNQKTSFGARFDIIADRFLWITFGVITFFYFYKENLIGTYIIELILVFSREILCSPFLLFYFLKGRRVIVKARMSGKITTFAQGFALPFLILKSMGYFFYNLSFYLSLITFISGIFAAKDYLTDIGIFKKNLESH